MNLDFDGRRGFRWKCLLQKPVATSGYVVNKVNGQDEFEVRLFEFSA